MLKRALSALAAAALIFTGLEVSAQERDACGIKMSLKPITNDMVQACQIEKFQQLIYEYAYVERYYWCHWQLVRGKREQVQDDVLIDLIQAELDLGLATARAAMGAAKKAKGAGDLAKSLDHGQDAAEHLLEAGSKAAELYGTDAEKDEYFRLAMNAMHQNQVLQQQIDAMKKKIVTDPNCPPDDVPPPVEEELQPDEELDLSSGVWSGYGMVVEIDGPDTLKITSDCRDTDHRIQVRGGSGTWRTVGVGQTVTHAGDLDFSAQIEVRRRCDHEYSGSVIVPAQETRTPR